MNRTQPNDSGVWKDCSASSGDQVLLWRLVIPPGRFRLSRHSSPSRGGVWAASPEKFLKGIANSTVQWVSTASSSFLDSWSSDVRWRTPSGSQVGGPVHQSALQRFSIVPIALISKVL
jgi:hypothetical protein